MEFTLSSSSIVIYLLFVNSITLGDANECTNLETYTPNLLWDNTSSSPKSIRFCNHFHFQILRQNSIKITGEKEEVLNRKTISACQEKMRLYFKEIKETEQSIDKYSKECKRFYNEWDECAEMIVQLRKLCYSMDSVSDLLKSISKEDLEGIGGYENIQLKEEYWKNFKDIIKLNAHECLLESINDKETEVIESYTTWYQNNKDSQCRCAEVIALYRLFKQWQTQDLWVSSTALDVYYSTMCLEKIDNRTVWTKDHFDGIVKSPGINNISYINNFLKRCQILAKYWYDPDDKTKNSHWPFHILSEQIKLDRYSVSEEHLKLVVYGIRAKMSADNFERFFELTNSVKGFESLDCKYKILESIFDVDKYENDIDNQDYLMKKRIWNFTKKIEFNKILELLLKIVHNSGTTSDDENFCEKFPAKIKEFEVEVQKHHWDNDFIRRGLRMAYNTNKTFELVIQCMKFGIDLLNAVKKFFGPESVDRFDDIKILKMLGRKNSIVENVCNGKHDRYNLKNEENIEELWHFLI